MLAGACATGRADADPAGLVQGRALFDEVRLALYGSAEDHLAVEQETAARFQGALAACMKAQGLTYEQAPSEKQNGGPLSFDDLASITEIRGDFGIATAKRNQAEVADLLHARSAAQPMTAAQDVTYGKALGRCTSGASRVEPVAQPGDGRLTGEFTGIFGEVEKLPAVAEVLAVYDRCMSRAGFRAKSYGAIYQQTLGEFPDASAGWSSMQNDPRWHQAVAYERRAAAADGACRQPAQDQAVAAAADELQQFVTTNRAQLELVRSRWAKLGS